MRILVTGGAGFIGSHLIEALLQRGYAIDCLDNFNEYYDPSIKRQNIQSVKTHSRFDLIEGDILDRQLLDQLFSSRHYSHIIHLAARAGVRPSIKEPLLYEQVNVRGTLELLEACRRHDIHRFIFASSSSVYGANVKVPFSEQDPVDCPISPYAATKKAGESICYTYHHLYDIAVVCLRFFTVYGPRQRPDMAITKFARRISKGLAIPVFGSGGSERDYTYITDIIQGVLASVDRCNGFEIFNLGESRVVRLDRLINLLETSLGAKAVIEHLPEQPGDVPVTFADISKARKLLNYDPQTSIEEGIDSFAKWFVKQSFVSHSPGRLHGI